MAEALARHRADQEPGNPVLTHRFLCPASRLDELRADRTPSAIRLGLILDTAGRPAARRISPRSRRRRRTARRDAPAGSELAADGGLPSGGRAAVRRGARRARYRRRRCPGARRRGLKVRCGGAHRRRLPRRPSELGGVHPHCVGARTSRSRRPPGCTTRSAISTPALGVDRHGFLNLVLAVCAAVEGRDPVPVLRTDRRRPSWYGWRRPCPTRPPSGPGRCW